jgi:hypothetical protein
MHLFAEGFALGFVTAGILPFLDLSTCTEKPLKRFLGSLARLYHRAKAAV